MKLIDKYLGEGKSKPDIFDLEKWAERNHSQFMKSIQYLQPDSQYKALLDLWKKKGKPSLTEAKKTPSTQMQCMECMKKFKKKIGPRTFEVKCPKCGSYDTEPVLSQYYRR